jgi:hypothetical protein
MPDNRDLYKPKHQTPAAGTSKVRAESSAEDEFEDDELTPVGGPIDVQIHARVKQAVKASRKAVKVVSELKQSHEELAETVREYASKDQDDHKKMMGQIAESRDDFKELSGQLSTVSTSVAKIEGKMSVLVPDIQEEKRAEKKVRAGIREAIWKTVIKVVGGVVTAIGVGYAGYLVHSWTHGEKPQPPAAVAPVSTPAH